MSYGQPPQGREYVPGGGFGPPSPGYGARPPSGPHTDALAILALVTGILALLGGVATLLWGVVTGCCPPCATFGGVVLGILVAVPAITGLVCGFLGYRRTTSQPEQFTGKGMALAGIITSGISLVLVVITIVGPWIGCGILSAITPPRDAGPPTSVLEGDAGPRVQTEDLPWFTQVRQNCQAYDAAPNEAQRSAVLRQNHDFVVSQDLTNVRGALTTLTTDQSGGTVQLTIEVGGATFTTGVFSIIRRGSPVYEQASALTQGQCVIFSARIRDENSVIDRSKVCDLDYFADFTAIAACPPEAAPIDPTAPADPNAPSGEAAGDACSRVAACCRAYTTEMNLETSRCDVYRDVSNMPPNTCESAIEGYRSGLTALHRTVPGECR